MPMTVIQIIVSLKGIDPGGTGITVTNGTDSQISQKEITGTGTIKSREISHPEILKQVTETITLKKIKTGNIETGII